MPTHKATVEKYGDSWTAVENFVGNGAYKPKLWVVNEKIVLERSPTYWNNKNTIIDEVTFLTIEQASIDVSRYLSGANDITLSVPIEQFNMLKQRYPNELIKENKLCTYYYELNQTKPPFNDVRVREAIKLAVDRDILTKRVKRQFDITAFSFTPPPFTQGAQLTKPEWLSNLSYAQRIAKAKKLLQEAGYSKKNPLEFSLLYNKDEAHKLLAIAVASMLKTKLGVNVNLENQEWKTFLETKRNKNHQMVRSGWCADYNEPSAFLNIFLSKSSNNNAGFASLLYDETLKSALSAKTPEARASTYQKAEEILDKESVIIPITIMCKLVW
ncbi:ABC transporter substrate-binding protein [Bartonella sp. DGB1]|uniref:ABC transporter substrate-binding protein n=1 Tax=Bartonella sp. DGB1 TaxID=3239807 RepID=UPI0035267D00